MFDIATVQANSIMLEKNRWGKRLLVDFDNVVHDYNDGWRDGIIYGKPIEGAREALQSLMDEEYEIYIFTSRLGNQEYKELYDQQLIRIQIWLMKNHIPYDGITGTKLPAFIYIDDRGLHFHDWESTLNEIKKRKIN